MKWLLLTILLLMACVAFPPLLAVLAILFPFALLIAVFRAAFK